MQLKGTAFFKVLINAYHAGPPQTLLKYLPEEESNAVLTFETSSKDPFFALTWPESAIARTHYSWLVPVIKQASQSLQLLIISALPEKQAESICKLLNLSKTRMSPTPIARRFLLNELYLMWRPEEAIPFEFTPQTSLSSLLHLSKDELVNLIDFLAIFDLADAIRHIVDKKFLKLVYLALPPQRQQFLRQCLHRKQKLASPKFDLASWDGSQEELQNMLHKRGLFRFGKALCGQGRHFLWHITHNLDIGRGKILEQYYNDDEIPGITPLLVQQVFSVIGFLKG